MFLFGCACCLLLLLFFILTAEAFLGVCRRSGCVGLGEHTRFGSGVLVWGMLMGLSCGVYSGLLSFVWKVEGEVGPKGPHFTSPFQLFVLLFFVFCFLFLAALGFG